MSAEKNDKKVVYELPGGPKPTEAVFSHDEVRLAELKKNIRDATRKERRSSWFGIRKPVSDTVSASLAASSAYHEAAGQLRDTRDERIEQARTERYAEGSGMESTLDGIRGLPENNFRSAEQDIRNLPESKGPNN